MKRFNNIVFDCDSTLTKIEGLDELARKKGLINRVQGVTDLGMNGEIPFSESLNRRLEIIRPTPTDLIWIGQRYIEELLPDAREAVNLLQNSGLRVHILSGGLLCCVEVLGKYLNISREDVYAVDMKSSVYGREFTPVAPIGDLDSFKVEAIKKIRRAGPTVLIGDGLTDYSAGKYADLFIGFGGVVKREKLRALSAYYIEEPRLQPVVDLVL